MPLDLAYGQNQKKNSSTHLETMNIIIRHLKQILLSLCLPAALASSSYCQAQTPDVDLPLQLRVASYNTSMEWEWTMFGTISASPMCLKR